MIALVSVSAFAAVELFAARATYLQVGAMLGTIMAANVFFVIIPAHWELVRAKQEGREPDHLVGLRAKQRSVHNNYLTLPVLFVMISNHYPMTWGHPHAWLVLMAILLLAGFVRHFFNLRHRGRSASRRCARRRRTTASHHRSASRRGPAPPRSPAPACRAQR